VDEVREGLRAACVLFALEDALALAAGVLKPDVIALEIVLFGFKKAARGEDDAAVRAVSESGDFVVDGLERFFLRICVGQGTTTHDHADESAEVTKPTESAASAETGHGLGCGAE